MATSINSAFSQFLNDTINISKSTSDNAKSSRTFLNEQIKMLSDNGNFLKIATEYNINFGSFARKTKIKPLDDIDLIIGLYDSDLQIEGTQWNNMTLKIKDCCTDKLIINVSDKFSQYWGAPIYHLNSNKVKNKLVSALQDISQYEKADINARGEAVTLKLKSYTWNFDIVPAFYCFGDTYTKPYYLIPNGNGQWKKTNPKLEQERVSNLNQKFNNVVLSTIRLVKYWNRRGQMPNITSYVLETMVLDYFDQTSHVFLNDDKYYDYPDVHFRDALYYISNHIMYSVQDTKGFQGDINTLTYEQKYKIKIRANKDYSKAYNAVYAEMQEKDIQKSMRIWKDIFGDEFPQYG